MKLFRLLKADEIECRVSNVSQYGVTLLLYKTARTDADLLDEKFGPFNWKNDFKVIDGVLYGGIGIYDTNTLEWVWKWDAGTESNTEAEKGRASDAFKRSGFRWGLGRELYSAPRIFVPAAKCKIEGGKCRDTFDVAEIGYDESEHICYLRIDVKGNPVFVWGQPRDFAAGGKEDSEQEEPAPKEELICADCGKPIRSRKRKDGSIWYADEIAKYTHTIAGRDLCVECGKAEQARQEATADGLKN